jgi:hypothetical protein
MQAPCCRIRCKKVSRATESGRRFETCGLDYFFTTNREEPLITVVRKRTRIQLPERPGKRDGALTLTRVAIIDRAVAATGERDWSGRRRRDIAGRWLMDDSSSVTPETQRSRMVMTIGLTT